MVQSCCRENQVSVEIQVLSFICSSLDEYVTSSHTGVLAQRAPAHIQLTSEFEPIPSKVLPYSNSATALYKPPNGSYMVPYGC